MAVTAVTIKTKGISGTLSPKYSDETITENFQIRLDAASQDLPAILAAAHAFTARFPDRGDGWPVRSDYGLYAKQFQFSPESELCNVWNCDVTYQPLDVNESNNEGTSDNPLLWPAVWNLEQYEFDEAIIEAKNITAFTGHYPRTANTLGALVNSFGDEFEEGAFEPVSDAIFSRTDNVGTLFDVLNVQKTYARTCNSDTIQGIGPRRFKFLNCTSGGVQTANGITYYQRVIRVQLMKTTDRVFNNTGWRYKEGADVKEVDGSAPVFLTLAGAKSDTPVVVRYRYLDEVPYASLLS